MTSGNTYTKLKEVAERAKRDPNGRFFSLAYLIDKDTLGRAFARLRPSAAVGVDGVSKADYGANLEGNLEGLHERLRGGRYRHQPILRKHIAKEGRPDETRPIGISSTEDKIVQGALREVLEAVYEQEFLPCSFGFRPKRGAHDAIKELRKKLKPKARGEKWVLELDIASYFDSLDRKRLQDMLQVRVPDGSIKRLVGKCLKVGILVGSQLDYNSPSATAESLGRQMGVVEGPTEAPRPKNVGLLFFNPKPHDFFPATQIDVVWLPEGAGGDRFEEKIFQGPLGRITRDALSFIDRSYLKQTIIKYPDRPEADRVWNFPLAAIEEAVVNAVYHRSYEIREPIEVRISQDDIVVLSFPGPDRSIRLDQLQKGQAVSRRYRNRRIGEFLKELELTEGRSTGITKIFKTMKANGSPTPEFETDDDRSYFITRLFVHSQTIRADDLVDFAPHEGQLTTHDGQTTAHDTPHDGPSTTHVTPQVAQLLKSAQGESVREELQARLEIKERNYFRKAYVTPAIKAGLLEMTLPDKPRSKNQKYRLTPAGKQWLKKHGA